MIIPATQHTVELEDISVDLLCYQHAFSVLRDRRIAGKLKGYVEATLEANRGLAGHGVLIAIGTVVNLPEFVIAKLDQTVRRLWD